MPAKQNLIGQKFNRLLVISEAQPRNKKTFWLCKCDCGNIIEARADSLKNNRIKSCGCLNQETRSKLGKSHLQDITGQRFGNLVAIKRLDFREDLSSGYTWLCQCDCGNLHQVRINDLKSGNTLSCGCLKESKGEQIICKILEISNIKYEREKTIPELGKLRFDFYLPNFNTFIEFDGPQHYNKKDKYASQTLWNNDKLKNKWCLENNCTLIRIPYSKLLEMQNWSFQELFNPDFKVIQINHYA